MLIMPTSCASPHREGAGSRIVCRQQPVRAIGSPWTSGEEEVVTLHRSTLVAAQAVGLVFILSGGAWAAPVPAKTPTAAAVRTKSVVTPVVSPAAQEAEITGSVEKAPIAEPTCSQSRRRLWVEGEGWIVRRVTTCY